MPVVGYLGITSPQVDPHFVAAFRSGLAELVYVEGRNVAIEYRWAEGRYDQLPELAADLVARKVAVIAAISGGPAALATQAATSTIPFLFITSLDLIATGIIESFNRPGRNATGVYLFTQAVEAKKLELLNEMAVKGAAIGFLVNPNNSGAEVVRNDMQAAARRLGRDLRIVNASSEKDIDAAFSALKGQQVGGLVVGSDPVFNGRREQMVRLAARFSIPAIYE
jgi:putative ABC transport system substrate-binding protein